MRMIDIGAFSTVTNLHWTRATFVMEDHTATDRSSSFDLTFDHSFHIFYAGKEK